MTENEQNILRSLQGNAPVDPILIARTLGIEVRKEPLPSEISGKIFKQGNRFTIVLNSAEGHYRQRFTTAHELAHYLLHRDLMESGEVVDNTMYRSRLGTWPEAEANILAARILMPDHLIDRCRARGVTATDELARALQVSKQAMAIRLEYRERERMRKPAIHHP